MANNLGQLIVKLGLDAAEFTRGLNKGEYEAQKFSRNTRTAILEVAKVLATLEIGRQVYESTKAIISEAAALNDLSDATGSSVEALSKLNNQAKIAGTDFGQLQTLVLKLSQGMANVDDETKDATRALQFLGISTNDPAEALQQIAGKLSLYQDGLGKVALATALFGKQGAAALPLLKDLAELADVNATITKKQAEEAEALEKSYRRLSAEATTFRNAILSHVVPALNTMIQNMRDATEVSGGLLQGILQFATIDDLSFGTGIAKLRAQIAQLKKEKIEGKDLFGDLGPEIKLRENQLELLLRRQRNAALALIDPANADARDLKLAQKPAADFTLKNDKSAKAVKETVSEVQRYIEALERQLDRTEELTTVEQILRDVQLDRVKGLRGAELDEALKIGQRIDALKAEKKAADEARKAAEDDAKARERMADAIARSVEAERREAQTLSDSNEQIREQIILFQGGEDALFAYTQAKLEKVAAEKEDLAAMLALVPEAAAAADAIRAQAAAIRERQQLLAQADFAKRAAAEAKYILDLEGQAFDLVGRAINDVALNGAKASDVVKRLAADMLMLINSEAFRKIKDLALGTNSGPNLFDLIPKIIGIGIGAGTGSTDLDFADAHYAGGTMSARRGLAWVGEEGPELVSMNGGERVYNARESAGMMGGTTVINNNQIVVQGTVNHATAEQIGRQVGWHTQDSMKR